MMHPDLTVKAVYLYPKPIDLSKFINGLAALVELDIKVVVFDPVLFVFLNRTYNRAGENSVLASQRFLSVAKFLEVERFKIKPDADDE